MSYSDTMGYVAEKLLCDKCLAKWKADPYDIKIGEFCQRCIPKFALDSEEYAQAMREARERD